MAAVMLRRVFLQLEYKDMLKEIDAGMLKGCQAELLIAIQTETRPHIQRKICDAVAELARSCIGKKNDPNIPYSGKLSKEKTFTNFTVLDPSAKVFLHEIWVCHTHL